MNVMLIAEGNGYGHASRLSLLATYFKEPIITFYKGVEFCKKEGIPYIDIGTPYYIDDENVALKLNINGMKRWFKPLLLKNLVDMAKEKDVIIGDTSLLALVIGKIAKKPVIGIFSDVYSNTFIPSFINPISKKTIAAVLNMFDSLLIPDFPPPYSISSLNLQLKKARFIGPMVKPIRQVKHNIPLVVSAGGNGIEVKRIKDLGLRFISQYDVKNIRQYYKHAKGILTHGGHTTIMEGIYYAKPLLFFVNKKYKERLNNSVKAESLGIGRIVSLESLPMAIDEIDFMKKRVLWFSKWARRFNPVKDVEDEISKFV